MGDALLNAGAPVSPANPLGARLGASFDEVYRQTFPMVVRSLRRLGVPASELEDAAQEVFVIVHGHLAEFEGRSQISTWVYGIACNVARNLRRKNGRRQDIDAQLGAVEAACSELLGAEPVARGPSPLAALESSQARALVESLLQRLDADKREVFVSVDLEGMEISAVADALQVHLSTVQYRLREARLTFEAALHRWKLMSERLPGAADGKTTGAALLPTSEGLSRHLPSKPKPSSPGLKEVFG